MGEAMHVWGSGIYGTPLYFLLLCCEPKTALKLVFKKLKQEKEKVERGQLKVEYGACCVLHCTWRCGKKWYFSCQVMKDSHCPVGYVESGRSSVLQSKGCPSPTCKELHLPVLSSSIDIRSRPYNYSAASHGSHLTTVSESRSVVSDSL